MRQSPPASQEIRGDAGLVFLIGCDPNRPGELSWPAQAALAAADAVVHDGSVDPSTLALVPPRCFVEAVPGDVARVGKLAAEGWRVVWLVVGAPAVSLGALVDAERLADAGVSVSTIAGLPGDGRTGDRPGAGLDATLAPQSFATALNGLAG